MAPIITAGFLMILARSDSSICKLCYNLSIKGMKMPQQFSGYEHRCSDTLQVWEIQKSSCPSLIAVSLKLAERYRKHMCYKVSITVNRGFLIYNKRKVGPDRYRGESESDLVNIHDDDR